MGIFDHLKAKNVVETEPVKPVVLPRNTTVSVCFETLPNNVEEFLALPQFSLEQPAYAAALFCLAMCSWADDKNAAIEMINALKGPEPLTPYKISFLNERVSDQPYKYQSYFKGSSPENDYTLDMPLTVEVTYGPYCYSEDESFADVLLKSSGADSERKFRTRRKGNKWYMVEEYLSSGIRIAKSSDPWA